MIAAGTPRPLVVALTDLIVVTDAQGGLLWAQPTSDAGPPERWEPVDVSTEGHVVALAGVPDLAGAGDLLAAAYRTGAAGLIRTWWRASGTHGWRRSDEIALGAPPAGLAAWSGPGPVPELVVALTDGTLVHGELGGASPPTGRRVPGFGTGVLGLSAVASGSTVEVYAATAEHRLALVRRSPGPDGQVGWGGVPTSGSEVGPVVASTCWADEGGSTQVVALDTGEVRERRRGRGAGWGGWASVLTTSADAPPTSLSGSCGGSDGSVLAVRLADGRLQLRPGTDGRWLEAQPSGSAERAAAEAVTAALGAADQPTERLDTGTPRLPTVEPGPPAVVQAEGATRLYTGRDVQPLRRSDPRQVGPFAVLGRVGGGQTSSDKYVARDGRGYCFLKVLRPDADDDAVTAFRREVSIARRVTDRAWLSTYVDDDDRTGARTGEPSFLALSWIPGEDLDTRIRHAGPLPPDDVVALAYDLMEAVRELRECAMFHCDVKPANIILTDGRRPVLVDFGSAVPDSVTHVREAAFRTPGYVAPEFVRAREVNVSTDLYAWGAVVVAAATGAKPADDPDARAAQIDRLPDVLRPLVTSALGDSPGSRPTLPEVRSALARRLPLRAGLSTTAFGLPDEPSPSLSTRAERRWMDLRRRAARLPGWQYRLVGLGIAGLGALTGTVSGLVVRELAHLLGGGS